MALPVLLALHCAVWGGILVTFIATQTDMTLIYFLFKLCVSMCLFALVGGCLGQLLLHFKIIETWHKAQEHSRLTVVEEKEEPGSAVSVLADDPIPSTGPPQALG